MARSSGGNTSYVVSPGVTAPSNYSFSIIVRNSGAPGTADYRIATELGPTSSSQTLAGFAWSHMDSAQVQSMFHRESGGTFRAAKLTSTLSADTWYCIGGRYNGTNITAWLNGTQEASTAAAAASVGASPVIYAGNGVFPSNGVGFQYAEVCWWSVALSDGEMAALGRGVSPLLIRPESIIDGASLVRGLIGYKGTTWTDSGSSVSDHPRVFMPAPQMIAPKAAPVAATKAPPPRRRPYRFMRRAA